VNRTVRRTKRITGALVALITALAVTTPPRGAAAQPQPKPAAREEAAVRFKKGLELFKEGDYRAALIEFRRAYELAPNFAVLYNIGQVYFQLQDYAGALNALDRYLTEGGSQVPAIRRDEVKKDIEKLKSRVANLEITANVPDAEIAIDDVPIGKAPLPKPVLVSAGRHKVSASKEGRLPATKVVDIAGTDTLRVSLELAEPSATTVVTPPPGDTPKTTPPDVPTDPPTTPPIASTTTTTPPPPPDSGSSAPIVAGWAITGGFTVGAVILGIFALDASSDLETQRATAGSTREQLDDAQSKTVTFALVTDILAAGAIVAGGVSIFLTVRGSGSDDHAKANNTLKVGVTPTGVRLLGTF
jgi:hypothetical protein